MTENLNESSTYKSGYVAIAGRPNVGKSTLMNALLGQKIAAVTPRAQTTRRQQLGILTLENAQIIFVDTPGIHKAKNKLGNWMNKEAALALNESDVILMLVDSTQPPHEEDLILANIINEANLQLPQILAINKSDLTPKDEWPEIQKVFEKLFPQAVSLIFSATTENNLDNLLNLLIKNLPFGPPLFPKDQITDLYEREIAADLIREAALLHLRDEIPHGIAIRMDEFIERGEKGGLISATIFVERESQKPIVIGYQGNMIKEIGKIARKQIEAMSGRKIFLKLRVKVRPNWRNNENVLNQFGFKSQKH